MPLPSWLPPMVSVNPWTDDTFDTLYEIFERDLKRTRLRYEGAPVWLFPEMAGDKEVIFWHLTHREDKYANERLPDLRRSERLPWVRALLDNANKPEVLGWDYLEADKTIKTYVWLRDDDFLVLMKKLKDGSRRLVTSYYVDYQHKRKKLKKKYSGRLR